MMKIKFNKFERVAGLFVLCAILGGVASAVGIAIKQGWFDTRIPFYTHFDAADGVHNGTPVQIAGLRAGSVDDVELTKDNKILIKFSVLSKFRQKIRNDSTVQLIRPFIIGERVLEVTVGSDEGQLLAENTLIESRETLDLMTLMSGKKIGNYLETMSGMMGNLQHLAEAFLDKGRTQSVIDMFDRIDPLLRNLNTMSVEVIKLSKQATKNENLGTVLTELAMTTKELNKIIPEMTAQAPNLGKDMAALVKNVSLLTEEFKVVLPALAAVAPDLPFASRRAVEALDEAVVLIKAMQKNFFVKGSAREVREEESKAGQRRPASSK